MAGVYMAQLATVVFVKRYKRRQEEEKDKEYKKLKVKLWCLFSYQRL